MEKTKLRKELINKRNSLKDDAVYTESLAVCRMIEESDAYKDARAIYAYYPLGNELDLRTLISKAWEDKKEVFLPKVSGKNMDFYKVSSFDELSEGSFHVMEPAGDAEPSELEAALVLTPGVGFDVSGNRIGFGAGYYDRYFERFPSLTKWGVCFAFQHVDHIEADEHDIRMDRVISLKEQ